MNMRNYLKCFSNRYQGSCFKPINNYRKFHECLLYGGWIHTCVFIAMAAALIWTIRSTHPPPSAGCSAGSGLLSDRQMPVEGTLRGRIIPLLSPLLGCHWGQGVHPDSGRQMVEGPWGRGREEKICQYAVEFLFLQNNGSLKVTIVATESLEIYLKCIMVLILSMYIACGECCA